MSILQFDSKHLMTRCKSEIATAHPGLLTPEQVDSIDSFEDLVNEIGNKNGQSSPEFLCQVFAKASKTDCKLKLEGLRPSGLFVSRYPISLARSKLILGFKADKCMLVGIVNQYGLEQLDIVARLFRCDVRPFFTTALELTAAINRAYQNRTSQTVSNIEALEVDNDVLRITGADREDLLDQAGKPPVIRLVNSLLFDAAQDRASDIHIQPYETKLQARFRIDGVLFDQFEIPKSSQEEVLSRIKIMGVFVGSDPVYGLQGRWMAVECGHGTTIKNSIRGSDLSRDGSR